MKVTARALAFVVLTTTLAPLAAQAAEPEKVVVRNRKFKSDGKFELAPTVGFSLVNFLTDHTNFTLGVAYNLTENWALNLAGGYALSDHTSVAQEASDTVVASDPKSPTAGFKTVDDFSNLWQMTWNTTLDLRWTPIYGKVNIAGELPVHFQFYLFLGGGVGGFYRDSLVYCIGNRLPGATCSANPQLPSELKALHAEAIKPIITGGVGLKFFILQWLGLKIEVRDMSFPDAYRVNINRAAAESDTAALDGDGSAKQGDQKSNPGFTSLVMAQVGVVFSF